MPKTDNDFADQALVWTLIAVVAFIAVLAAVLA